MSMVSSEIEAIIDTTKVHHPKQDRSSGTSGQSQQQPITLILPTSGKLFFEKKRDFELCKPQLLPLKSFSLEKLEKMQKEAHRQLQETRARTAATVEKF
ncbi:BBSome-interacting protein 1 [Uranotaenia lowii]|uniref:BBSome-interacting protein 1 n=1 Tax=Uranotaenia lowii TaxID=190385 RepID=UPI00247A14FC|nr:BBSome-interacting protein 1 [Uranotaenia lowii]XP_055603725.1 BBSome-interacting protein 1 [Uranotaenia lowii]